MTRTAVPGQTTVIIETDTLGHQNKTRNTKCLPSLSIDKIQYCCIHEANLQVIGGVKIYFHGSKGEV